MPLINLYGNSVLKKELYIKSFLNQNTEYIRLYSDDRDKIEIISGKARNISLFSKKTVIDLVDFDKWKSAEKKNLLSLSIPENVTVFVRTEKQLSEKNENIKSEKSENIKSKKFTVPEPWKKSEWISYIEELLTREKIEYESNVPEYLFEVIGANELAIYNEIKKLKVLDEKINIDLAKKFVHKYAVSKLDEFCFLISEKSDFAYSVLDDILKDFEPKIIMFVLSKHFIELFNIMLNVEYKEKYIWPEIKSISKKLGISLSKVSRFLGFKFSGQDFQPKNHLKIYGVTTLKDIIKKLYVMERSLKSGGIFKVELIEFIKYIREE
ncbi:DNA polymerase III subunit delta [Thermosipho atlanticus]|uniref:DNA polymerase III, delta subunit n=1 Tax=Thermosipho atlanticus DSM 15807 TaxID=1123380 RepID=A0A1M5U4N9_9BACT|nr:DNA polymerase III subunit delta [Thermosipho atlanticus]SHH57987.1 DNA polymerase III, delta subunit [Thermosipho atlanticus DSM 15807]